MVGIRLRQGGQEGRVCFNGGEESVAEGRGEPEDPTAWTGCPPGLEIAHQGLDVLGCLGTFLPLDGIFGQQMTDKGPPSLGEFGMFDVEVGDGRISFGTLLD